MKKKQNRKGKAELECLNCGNLTKRRINAYPKGIYKEPKELPLCHRKKCRDRFKYRVY